MTIEEHELVTGLADLIKPLSDIQRTEQLESLKTTLRFLIMTYYRGMNFGPVHVKAEYKGKEISFDAYPDQVGNMMRQIVEALERNLP